MKQMLMKKPVSKMAGLTLLETMFAIAVGALILIAAVIFYTSSKQSQNVSKAVTDIQTIVAQTNAYIAPGKTALDVIGAEDADSVSILQGAGYLASDLVTPWMQKYAGIVVSGNANAVKGSSTTAPTNVVATTTITVGGLEPTDSTCKAIQQALTSATSAAATGTGCSIIFNL